MAIPIPSGYVAVQPITADDVLHGDRVTSYRWEVLTHANGVDTLAGYLDGVVEPSANLDWALYSAVKGSGTLRVADVETAKPGHMRIRDLQLNAVRLRPVQIIDGLGEIPWGVYLITAGPESWSESGRELNLELLDRCSVLDQDHVETTYTVQAGAVILQAVATLIASSGESITVDASITTALGTAMTWEADTSKLTIVNDLLAVMAYNALWVDGVGRFRTTPYERPAQRSLRYEMLNLNAPRELVDGDASIYVPEWTRDLDMYSVPNKVIALQVGSGSTAPLSGVATNVDPSSPYSYPARGFWRTRTITVEVPAGTVPEMQAYLDGKARASLIAMSSVQAAIEVEHLPIPVRVSDVLRFANAPADIDGRHVLTALSLAAHPLGLMKSTLQEVIDL